MSTSQKVSIYDPNDLNPYGLEIARTISSLKMSVVYWGVDSRTYPTSKDFAIRPGLAGSVKRGRLLRQLTRRLWGPLRVAFSAGMSSPLVLAWTRDPWDTLIFLARARLGGRTMIVYHNPAQVRPRPGLQGQLERSLLSHSRVCVHATWMADLVREQAGDVVVTPHPPFTFASEIVLHDPSELRDNPVPRIAIVGGLRPDKGSADLPSIARASSGGWTLFVAGPDTIETEIGEELEKAGVTVEYVAEGRAPTDSELNDALRASDAMLAPYRLVTESGSVLLALTLGLPVLGYESSSLARLVTSRSLVSGPQELGERLQEFIECPWETFRMNPEQLAAESRQGWQVALG